MRAVVFVRNVCIQKKWFDKNQNSHRRFHCVHAVERSSSTDKKEQKQFNVLDDRMNINRMLGIQCMYVCLKQPYAAGRIVHQLRFAVCKICVVFSFRFHCNEMT